MFRDIQSQTGTYRSCKCIVQVFFAWKSHSLPVSHRTMAIILLLLHLHGSCTLGHNGCAKSRSTVTCSHEAHEQCFWPDVRKQGNTSVTCRLTPANEASSWTQARTSCPLQRLNQVRHRGQRQRHWTLRVQEARHATSRPCWEPCPSAAGAARPQHKPAQVCQGRPRSTAGMFLCARSRT